MKHLPFDKPGKFWRGNIHTHSTLSDGHLPLERVCQVYHEAGYDFLAVTDHLMEVFDWPLADTRPLQTADFTTLIGAELHTGETELGNLWHLLAVGLPLDFAPPADDETGPEIAARALEAGAYVAVAHPYWYTLTEADVLSLGPVHAIEVFNAVSVDHNDRANSWYMLDLLLARGHRYFACATDDAHFDPHFDDALHAWVWVKSETLSPAGILAALKAGEYYSSTGPQIHDIQVVPGERIAVRCSPASRIFVTGARDAAMGAAGYGITEAEWDLDAFGSPYCRVTVRDAQGNSAWSNPIWFED